MENAIKALLIAAAVLIVILIIALGVRLLGSVGDTSSQAQTASDDISDASDEAIADIQLSLNNGSKDYTYSLLNKYVTDTTTSKENIKASNINILLKAIEKYNKNASQKIFVVYRIQEASGKTKIKVSTHNKNQTIEQMYTELESYSNKFKDKALYTIKPTGKDCSVYKNNNGLTSDNYCGCITIIEQELKKS